MKKPINSVDPQEVAVFHEMSKSANLFDTYQKLAIRSAIYPGKGTPFGLMYAALGLSEAGEAQNKVKKLFRDDGVIEFEPHGDFHAVYFQAPTEERKRQVLKEIGGLLWYAAAVCSELGHDLSTAADMNLRELASRAARGTLGGSGDNR